MREKSPSWSVEIINENKIEKWVVGGHRWVIPERSSSRRQKKIPRNPGGACVCRCKEDD
jgi:hypothetical protein